MKDAKGHGSNSRGGRSQMPDWVRTRPNPRFGNLLQDVKAQEFKLQGNGFVAAGPKAPLADKAAADVLGRGNPKAGPVPVHAGASGRFKVQGLDTDLAGPPWRTMKRYGRRAVAEKVAQHMRTDGGYTRVR